MESDVWMLVLCGAVILPRYDLFTIDQHVEQHGDVQGLVYDDDLLFTREGIHRVNDGVWTQHDHGADDATGEHGGAVLVGPKLNDSECELDECCYQLLGGDIDRVVF